MEGLENDIRSFRYGGVSGSVFVGTEKAARKLAQIPAFKKIRRTAVQDLGFLGGPGRTLGGKTYALKPGETLQFETSENHITGIMDFKVEPVAALIIERKVIRERPPGQLGGSTGYEWRISVPANARPGTMGKLTSEPTHQARNMPAWKFWFVVKVD